jgi:hypothetical protein
MKKNKCTECGDEFICVDWDNDIVCEDCCDHGDICPDERICLVCGKDLTEDLSAKAYDRYKDYMKYGE